MNIPNDYHIPVILILTAYMYMKSMRTVDIEEYKKVKIAFGLYICGVMLSGIALIGMLLYRNDIDNFIVWMGTYFLGWYVKKGGELIYTKRMKKLQEYKSCLLAFAITIKVILFISFVIGVLGTVAYFISE